jgi:hypothetical protein
VIPTPAWWRSRLPLNKSFRGVWLDPSSMSSFRYAVQTSFSWLHLK